MTFTRIQYESARSSYQAMINRCYDPKHRAYRWYGAKGVTVCERWRHSIKAFIEDVGFRPSPQHSLDRYPNRSGNYEPGNVRWATQKEQTRNRSSNHILTYAGESMCVAAWAERLGISVSLINGRINRDGWPVERVLADPPMAMNDRRRWAKRKGNGTASRFLGVSSSLEKRINRWRAEITHKGKKYHLGRYATEEEAARAYDVKAQELLGQAAVRNFPG